MPGTLYLVATPIGNLKDISFRAIETLKEVDMIACEDTRHSRKLLNHYGISKKLVSYHEYNERDRALELLKRLADGESIAIISDAGTPAINDPGFLIVQKVAEADIRIVPIPGPVSYVNAVIVSGLPTDSIFFGGFLPSKKAERRKRLEEVKTVPATLAFFESPHRLSKSLNDCLDILGNRRTAVVRELTKVHEEIVRGKLGEIIKNFSNANIKGEFVLVIDRAGEETISTTGEGVIVERVRELERSGVDSKTALKTAAKEFGISRSEAYRRIQLSGK